MLVAAVRGTLRRILSERFTRVGAVAAVSLAFAAVFCWPLFEFPGRLGVQGDWDQYLVLHWVPYETVRQYGQVPLWNPYVCGGMPMLGNPQSRWLTPFFLFHLLAGPELGLQLEIVAHVALAWAGAFVLGRTVGLSRLSALAPATIFAGSSYHYLHLAEGHVTWLAFAYLPWVLAAAWAGRPMLAGIALALGIGEGGVYAVPLTVVALVLVALSRAMTLRSARPFAHVAVAGAVAACLAAPKLLLVQPLMARYPRLIESAERMGPELMIEALLGRMQDLETTPAPSGYEYGIHEYGAYVGPLAVLLALAGAFAARRVAAPWLLLLGAALMLSFGTALGGAYSPWALLHQLPVFASLRIPSRFLIMAVLAIAMLAGAGVERLVSTAGRGVRRAAIALLLAATVDMALVGSPNLRHLVDLRAATIERSETFIQVDDGDDKRMYALARANRGALDCYEPLKPAVEPIGAGTPGYRGEEYLLADGTVRRIEWSPNRLAFEVSSNLANTLVVNSNYDESWRVIEGAGEVFSHDGLLAVRIPAGSHRLSIAYRSPRFMAGVLLALAAAAVIAWRVRRDQTSTSGSPRSAASR